MAKEDLVEIVFYVNPQTNEVDDAFSFTPFGMFYRLDNDWEFVTPEDSGLYDELANHKGYSLDWDTDEVEMSEDFDFEDYDSVTHEALKLYDKGELTLEELRKYATLSIDPVSEKEMDKSIRAHQKVYRKN